MPCALHYCDTYFNLSENWIHTQVTHLNQWDTHVLTKFTRNLESANQISSIFARNEDLPPIIRKSDSLFYRLFGFFPSYYVSGLQYDPDIMHAHFGPAGCEALPIAQLLGIPLVTTFYGYDASLLPSKNSEWSARYNRLFKEGDCFFAEGEHMSKQLQNLGCPEAKIHIQHLGVKINQYPFTTRTKEKDEQLRVLMIGRFTEKKGLPDGLKAFAQFVSNGGNGVLTIIGDSNDDAEGEAIKKKLRTLVDAHDLYGHVDFRGYVSLCELREAYYDHHVLLAPSKTASTGDNEGGAPVTLVEAQATGLPVVSSVHCDIPEVVKHQKGGLLAPEGDVNTFSNHLLKLYELPGCLQEMGKAGRRHIEAEYNASTQGKRLSRIYSSLC